MIGKYGKEWIDMTIIRYAEERDRDFWFRLDGHLAESEFMQKVLRRQGYVLEEDGQIVGSGTVLPDGGTEAEIVAAFLIPESIGRGYGRKLFETLEADELAVKAERVWLTSSDMALGFYEHMGWVNPNGYRVRAGEENLLYMEKRK